MTYRSKGRKPGTQVTYSAQQTERYKSQWIRYIGAQELLRNRDLIYNNGEIKRFRSKRSPVGYWEVSRRSGSTFFLEGSIKCIPYITVNNDPSYPTEIRTAPWFGDGQTGYFLHSIKSETLETIAAKVRLTYGTFKKGFGAGIFTSPYLQLEIVDPPEAVFLEAGDNKKIVRIFPYHPPLVVNPFDYYYIIPAESESLSPPMCDPADPYACFFPGNSGNAICVETNLSGASVFDEETGEFLLQTTTAGSGRSVPFNNVTLSIDNVLGELQCTCPDWQKKVDANPKSKFLSERIDRDWTDSDAGAPDPPHECKHMIAAKIIDDPKNLKFTWTIPTDVPSPYATAGKNSQQVRRDNSNKRNRKNVTTQPDLGQEIWVGGDRSGLYEGSQGDIDLGYEDLDSPAELVGVDGMGATYDSKLANKNNADNFTSTDSDSLTDLGDE